MKKIIYLFCAALLPSIVQADCDVDLDLSNVTVSASETAQTIPITFEIEGDDEKNNRCQTYRLFFSKGLANSYQRKAYNLSAGSYDYNLHQNANLNGILKERNDALAVPEYVSGLIPDDDVESLGTFYISIPPISSILTRAGTYRDIVQVAIYSSNNNGELEFVRTECFSIFINVPSFLSVSVVDEGAPYDLNATSRSMDFGTLEANDSVSADIIVSANTPYRVRISSLNSGNLMNQTNSVIPYQLMINNSLVALNNSVTSPVNLGQGNSPTSTQGRRFSARFTVPGIPGDPDPGVYTDSLTVSITAN